MYGWPTAFPRESNEGGHTPAYLGVTAASQNIVRANKNRKKITLVNDSANVIYVAKADTAILNAGIRLNANGGSVVDEPDQTGYLYTGPWAAIAGVAGPSNLCVQEN